MIEQLEKFLKESDEKLLMRGKICNYLIDVPYEGGKLRLYAYASGKADIQSLDKYMDIERKTTEWKVSVLSILLNFQEQDRLLPVFEHGHKVLSTLCQKFITDHS